MCAGFRAGTGNAHSLLNETGEDVVYHRDVNLGIAVALDWGLVVPVVRNADSLSIVGLQKAVTDVAERAGLDRAGVLEAVRTHLGRFFGKRGGAVVDANMAVIEQAYDGVIDVTAAIAGAAPSGGAPAGEAPPAAGEQPQGSPPVPVESAR